MKKVLINCDDLGMHPTINEAILDILVSDLPAQASLMAPGVYFDDAVERAKNLGLRQIGAHLTLGSEYKSLPMKALSPASECASFTRGDGVFYPDIRSIRDTLCLSAVKSELLRQVERIIDQGFRVTHLDGHMFFYDQDEGGDPLTEIAKEIAIELDVPIRLRSEPETETAPLHFIWEGYDSIEARFAFYDRIFFEESFDFSEIIIHPGKSIEDMLTFTGCPLRRYADYLYFSNPEKTARLRPFVARYGNECPNQA